MKALFFEDPFWLYGLLVMVEGVGLVIWRRQRTRKSALRLEPTLDQTRQAVADPRVHPATHGHVLLTGDQTTTVDKFDCHIDC